MQALPGYLLLVTLHLVTAGFWFGAVLFFALGLRPVVRRPRYAGVAEDLIEDAGRALRRWGWASLGLLVASGLLLLLRRFGWARLVDPGFWGSPLGGLLLVKGVLVLLLAGVTALHDFWLGPQATRLARQNPGDPQAVRGVRRRSAWVGRGIALLSLLVFGVSALLARPGLMG